MVAGRPIRVGLDAHVVGRRKTGNETYVVGLGRALAARPDVALTAFLDDGTPWPGEALPSGTDIVGLTARRRMPRLALELPVRSRRTRLDILHVQYVMPPIAGVPAAVAIHDLSFEDRPELFTAGSRRRLRATVRPSARHAAVVLALSAFTRGRILHHYDLDPARVVVVPAGIDAVDRDPTDEAADREHLASVGVTGTFVLHVGDLIPRKNVPRLVTAIARLRRDGIGDLTLVLAGQPGRDSAAVTAAIATAAGGEDVPWVRRPGYVDATVLEGLYRHATVVAQPSLYEGFGLPALEAMARSAVLVTSSTSALPEVVGDAGLLADPEDVGAIADAIARAITDKPLRARLAAAGPERARRFSWEHAAGLAVDAYRIGLDR